MANAGLVGTERRGRWPFYFVLPDALAELEAWLAPFGAVAGRFVRGDHTKEGSDGDRALRLPA